MTKLESFSFEKPFKPIDVDGCIAAFMNGRGKNKGRKAAERYSSFDYCFNYFQSFREGGMVSSLVTPEHRTTSCLHIAWFLASWGMLRNSTLLERSLRAYEPLIDGIASFESSIWDIDVDRYDTTAIKCLLSCKAMIRDRLRYGRWIPSDTLVTKIMLGVFGNVPALDNNFQKGMGVRSLVPAGLQRIRGFYDLNKEAIDRYRVPTLDVVTGGETHRLYTKAKIIDMIGFIEGGATFEDAELDVRMPAFSQ